MVDLTASAHCWGCDWTEQGDPAATDKAAQKHTAVGHPTGVTVVPR